MRKVKFSVANSLDNFIARKDGAVDWLMWSGEAALATNGVWQNVDAVLMGRKTYEFALAQSKGKKNSNSSIRSYVFSRTLQSAEDAQVISENATDFVRDLKQKEGKDICVMGGGDFAKTLFEADLIDEIGFNIHPVLLGSGIPIFYEMKRQIDLELLTCKPFKNGCVAVTYRVKH